MLVKVLVALLSMIIINSQVFSFRRVINTETNEFCRFNFVPW